MWCSRILTCSALYLAGTDPSRDYLGLSHGDPNWEPIPGWPISRLYFSASLILELFVSPILTLSTPPLTSLFEMQVVVISLVTLKVVRPPSIRLIESTTASLATRSSSLPPAPAPRLSTPWQTQVQGSDLLGSLTLSDNPLATIRTNPIFGSSSLQNLPSSVEEKREAEDPDAMDWSPTNPSPKKETVNPFLRAGSAPVRSRHGEEDEELVLRRQRFFPPEEPTGLEGLLGNTVLAESPPAPTPGVDGDGKETGGWWKRRLWLTKSS